MRRRFDPRREDGVAMAEFALIAPVFLLLVVGMIVVRPAASSTGSRRTTSRTRRLGGRSSTATRTTELRERPLDRPAGLPDAPAARAERRHGSSSRTPPRTHLLPRRDTSTVETGDPVRVKVHVPVTFLGSSISGSRCGVRRRCAWRASRNTATRRSSQTRRTPRPATSDLHVDAPSAQRGARRRLRAVGDPDPVVFIVLVA